MRTLILISMISVPAFAAKSELEPKSTTRAQILTCETTVTKTRELKQGECRPANELPKTLQSLGERKSK